MELSTHPFAFLCYAAIIAGAAACVYVIRSYFEWRSADRWPHTTGEVLESTVLSGWTGSSDESPGDPRFRVRVRYRYAVDRREYSGQRMTLTRQQLVCQHESTADILRRQEFPVGKAIRVYYNPARPRSATLDRSVDNKVLLLVLLAGLALPSFALAAYGGLFAARRSLLAELSDPLLAVAVLLFAAMGYVALRVPGERLLDRDFDG